MKRIYLRLHHAINNITPHLLNPQDAISYQQNLKKIPSPRYTSSVWKDVEGEFHTELDIRGRQSRAITPNTRQESLARKRCTADKTLNSNIATSRGKNKHSHYKETTHTNTRKKGP